jgi:hypothetical protein
MALADKPYLFGVTQPDDAVVQEAFYECFSTTAGQLVLDRLYWQVMMRDPEDLRAVGQQDLFRLLIETIQMGWARKQGTFDGHGHTAQ